MISAKDWWAVFTHYNETFYPMQWIVMILATALILWVFIKPSRMANRILMSFLALSNAWTGMMFFIIIGTGLPSPLRFIQGSLFVVIGLLLGIDAISGKTEIKLSNQKIEKNITLLLLFVIATYPFIGMLRGHSVYQLVYPGTLPCATTALTLLLLSTALPNTNKGAYILLLIWAIPFAPLIQIPVFKVYEDIIMFVIGLYSLIALIVKSRKERTS